MKITFVIPEPNLSGGSRIIAEHAKMLHERGHTVTIVGCKPKQHTLRDYVRSIVRRRKLLKPKPKASHYDNAPYEVRLVPAGTPVTSDDVPDADVVIATWWATAEWVWDMPASKGVKVNFLQHHEVHPWVPADRVHAIWRLPMQKIVVSNWLLGIARVQYGDDQAVLVPNGLDTDQFKFVPRVQSGRNIIGAMYSGMKPGSFKRFWLAADAVRVLQQRGFNCEFVGFGGKHPEPGHMPEGSRFEQAPSQDRIAEIYASCDCWLFTSDKEGYGLPLLESISCGTPLVATKAGAAPELLESGCGELVEEDTPEAIADAVMRICSLPDSEWELMSVAGRREAEKHSWSRVGDLMEQALIDVLDREQK
jgi:glycosyltransferase involved in cell wall biosynthesis